MSAINTHTYVLPSGTKIEVENLPDRGAREVGPDQELPFQKILEPLGEVADLVLNTVRSAIKVPETVTVELGAALKGKTSLVLVSGQTEATMKITLTWRNASS